MADEFVFAGSVKDNAPYAKQPIVYHVNYFDVRRSKEAMRNAQNLSMRLAKEIMKSDSYSTEMELNY